MSDRFHRRRFLTRLGAVAVSVGVAGCSSGSDDSDVNPDTDESESYGISDSTESQETASADDPEPTETGTNESEPTGSEDSPGSSELPTYTFSEGESYTYDTVFGDGESEETWSVTSVDGDNITVERVTVANGETNTQSISGTHSTIFDEVEQARDINYFPLIRGALIYRQKGELSAGNSFTVQSTNENDSWETATVDVAGESTVNGVTCTQFTVSPDSVDQVQTVCLADDYPFAVSLSFEQQGEVLIEMSLTDHER
jgi:hypothetical protein